MVFLYYTYQYFIGLNFVVESKHTKEEKVKVLFISGGDAKYGAPKSMMTLMMTLKKEYGVIPVLLTKKHNELNDFCDKNGIENYSCWYRDIMAGAPYSSKILTIAKHIVKYGCFLYGGFMKANVDKSQLNFDEIDIVHTNTNRLDIGAYIAKKYNIRHVWHIREMGREDYNVVCYKRRCIQYMNQNADVFITISDAVAKKWIQKGIEAKKVRCIYNGIEPELITRKEYKTTATKKIEIVITGHIQPNKGQLQIVEAIALLPDLIKEKISLDIIGEAYPDYKRKILKSIKRNQLESIVRFTGYQKNIFQILSNYDIGFTGSRAEGFGRCTVEYMMAGLLTIASDTGANPELIEDKRTGILYRYGDVEDLSKKIEWVITHEDERNCIAQNGCEFVRIRYSQNKSAAEVYEVYKECLNQL